MFKAAFQLRLRAAGLIVLRIRIEPRRLSIREADRNQIAQAVVEGRKRSAPLLSKPPFDRNFKSLRRLRPKLRRLNKRQPILKILFVDTGIPKRPAIYELPDCFRVTLINQRNTRRYAVVEVSRRIEAYAEIDLPLGRQLHFLLCKNGHLPVRLADAQSLDVDRRDRKVGLQVSKLKRSLDAHRQGARAARIEGVGELGIDPVASADLSFIPHGVAVCIVKSFVITVLVEKGLPAEFAFPAQIPCVHSTGKIPLVLDVRPAIFENRRLIPGQGRLLLAAVEVSQERPVVPDEICEGMKTALA